MSSESVWWVAIPTNGFMQPSCVFGVDLRQIASIDIKAGYGPDSAHWGFNVARKIIINRRAENVRAKTADNDSCYLRVSIIGAGGDFGGR